MQEIAYKHIGITIVTMVGATICANEIIRLALLKNSNGAHPEITMHALPFKYYKSAVTTKNWGYIAELILESINKIKAAGADFVIIPSNTPHYAIRSIQQHSPLPVLNLIQLVVEECKKQNYSSATVLGTIATMQDGLYSNALVNAGVKPIIPPQNLCNKINRLIMDQIIPSTIDFRFVEDVGSDVRLLKSDVAILGCTELPQVYNSTTLKMPVLDTTYILAKSALDFATQKKP